uniref:Heat shock protein 70 n=1 Tax=Panagrolaimus superbus TaxID=310955 RepID=A0A914YMN1_9BILA
MKVKEFKQVKIKKFSGDIYVDVTFVLDKNGLLTVTAKSPTSSAEETIDYRKVRQAGKPIEQLFKELALNADSDQQKKILIEARTELRSNVENIKNRYQNEKNVPHNKKQSIIESCEEVIEWLDEHPDETLDEERINLAKKIEKDAKELIDLRLMTISG